MGLRWHPLLAEGWGGPGLFQNSQKEAEPEPVSQGECGWRRQRHCGAESLCAGRSPPGGWSAVTRQALSIPPQMAIQWHHGDRQGLDPGVCP